MISQDMLQAFQQCRKRFYFNYLHQEPDKLCVNCKFWQGYKVDGTMWRFGECERLADSESFDWDYCQDDHGDYVPDFATPPSFGCILWEKGETEDA